MFAVGGGVSAPNATAAVMAPRTRIAFEKMKDGNGRLLQRPEMLKDLPFLHTTTVPTDETHGTANNATRIITGYWPAMLIGIRSEFRVELLRERFADNFQYGFLAHLRADVELTDPRAFCQIKGILPGS